MMKAKLTAPLTQDGATSWGNIPEEERANLAASLALALPALTWRWHGIGCLQAYLYEGFTIEERVHIWDKALVLPGMAESGNMHNHRFDFSSTVLVGSLCHSEVYMALDPKGTHAMYDFVHARAHTDENRTELRPTGERYDVSLRSVHFEPGEYYEFARGHFHTTTLVTEMAVTIIQKRRQCSTRAQVLAPANTQPVPAFSTELTKELTNSVVSRAVKALQESAKT